MTSEDLRRVQRPLFAHNLIDDFVWPLKSKKYAKYPLREGFNAPFSREHSINAPLTALAIERFLLEEGEMFNSDIIRTLLVKHLASGVRDYGEIPWLRHIVDRKPQRC